MKVNFSLHLAQTIGDQGKFDLHDKLHMQKNIEKTGLHFSPDLSDNPSYTESAVYDSLIAYEKKNKVFKGVS